MIHLPTKPLFGSLAILWAALGGNSYATAGPGRYDAQARMFHLTYTYANLPGGIGSTPGTLREPTEEQDARVRALIADVSRTLYTITGGRARIGTFERVRRTEAADVIVALQDHPGRAAWAHVGALGAQGHLAFYYEYLLPQLRPDVALTAVHELCHYLFALPDEYPPQGACCPAGNQGPGCLMDNYWSQGGRGWYQRLCRDDDHNPRIPVRHAGRSYQSCQALVDAFFARYGIEAGSSDPTTAVDSSVATLAMARQLTAVQEALRRARQTAQLARRLGVTFHPAQVRDHVVRLLQTTLREQGLSASAEEIDRAADRIALAVGLVNPTDHVATAPRPADALPLEVMAAMAVAESRLVADKNGLDPTSLPGSPLVERIEKLDPAPAIVPPSARRTAVVAPPPTEPAFDLVNGLDHEPVLYSDLVSTTAKTFLRLLGQTGEGLLQPRDVELATSTTDVIVADRIAGAGRLLDEILAGLNRREIEGVILIVPPGGLPRELNARLQSLHVYLMAQVGVRFDVVQVGTAPIDESLRDLVAQSGGTLLTLSDTHEIGAIAQRLRNEHSAAASWVVPPRTLEWLSVAPEHRIASPQRGTAMLAERSGLGGQARMLAALDSSPLAATQNDEVRFLAEADAELEIIVGLSHATETVEESIRLRFLDDAGHASDIGGFLELDTEASSSWMRVYRLRASVEFPETGVTKVRESGWYRLRVEPAPSLLARGPVRATISIAAIRPGMPLTTGLWLGGTSPGGGVVDVLRPDPACPDPVVEVQLGAGGPILGATVRGAYQYLTTAPRSEALDPVDEFVPLSFHDDGREGDRVADDGVYAARIRLLPAAVPPPGGDLLVVVQAIAEPPMAHYLIPEPDPGRRQISNDPGSPAPPLPALERATTLRFYVRHEPADRD